ncbi:MAG: sigma-54-dependent transcriptional regulator, partial [Myxococcaceae bacterium]
MPPVPPSADQVRVLVIDDEEGLLHALKKYLARNGFEVRAASDPLEGLAMIAELPPEVVMLDIRMPNISGMDVLAEIKAKHPDVEVVMMTAHATVQTAVQAVKQGAYDYLTKPFETLDHVALTLRKACERRRLLERNRALETLLEVQDRFEDLIGRGPKMQAVFRLIEMVSASTASVLIQGESGTGKELVARAVHRRSQRKDRPFVAVNCSAFTDTLLESELCG